MGRSTVHYADNETNNILKRLHNKLRPAGTPVERVEYIIELLLLRIFEAKLKQDEIFKPLRKLFDGENYRLLFSYIHSLSNGDRVLSELNKTIFPFYASILQEARKVIKGNLPQKMQDQLVLMEEVFANSNFTNNVKGGVITEVIGLISEIEEKYILKTDLLGDAIESALSETGGTKDLGLYRTPDHIRRMMVAMIDPDFTDSIFDPACGTAGFLFDAYDYVIEKSNITGIYPSKDIANMFYRTGIGGIEYQGRIRKMAAVNMYIRGLNPHNIMQGDSLKMFDLARDAESKTVVVANPPFGAERDQPAYPNVWEEYPKESETTILFVKLMFDYLKAGGRCAVIVSEGFLTWGQGSACALRKMLFSEANLRAIISLPQGVFVSKGGQGAKTSILYFEKGQPTDFVWYYKIENDGFSMGTNRKPIEGGQIPELLSLFSEVRKGNRPQDTSHSFCVSREQIETLDPRAEKRITQEVTETMQIKNALKREKKVAELDKKLAAKKISKTLYDEELSQFDSNLEAQIENAIAQAIEKAHTYHFNVQNYRSNLTAEQQKQILQLLPNRNVNPADALHIDLLREYLQTNADKLTPDLKKVDEILRNDDKFPMVQLSTVLQQYENKITIDDEVKYKQITVSNSGEVKLREIKYGEEIGTKKQNYIDLSNGDLLIYSRLGLHTGAIGLIPKDLGGAIATVDMPVFSFHKNDNPRFISLMLQSKMFINKVITQNPTGAAQTRFHEDKFLSLQIPLPLLEIQNEIVEKIEKQKQIIEGARKIEGNWLINIPKFENSSKKFIKEIAEIKSGGTPTRAEHSYWQPREINWVKTGEINYSEIFNTEEKISKKGVENSSAKIIKANTLLMAMYGQGVTRGRVAILRIDAAINQACAAFTNLDKEIDLKYLFYYLMFEYDNIRTLSFGTNQENLNAKIIEEFIVEYPSFEIQQQIVAQLDKQMAALESVRFLKAEAEKRIEEILAGVWGEKTVEEKAQSKTIKFKPKICTIAEKAILAGHIINLTNNEDFGRVKFQKLLHLAEYCCKIDMGSNYVQKAAGPHDEKLINAIESTLKQYRFYDIRKVFSGNHDKVNYTALASAPELDTLFKEHFKEEEIRIENFLAKFKNSTWKQCEIVSTLYAVWNNRIIRQEPVTDELLKEDFLNWDAQKAKYKNRLDDALTWMRKKDIVPDGWGKVIEKAGAKIKISKK